MIERTRLALSLWRTIFTTDHNGRPLRMGWRQSWSTATGLTTPPPPRVTDLCAAWWRELEHRYDGDEGWPVGS